ncbi:indole-3-glycerol phosphate synthase TrpC [Anaerobacillus alkaliphilus]|uniref:Indole-3-glycerol phosphate synthase n=1 Tax=Anaerobacillus alkaliphilus TaxID=1548597 RepID=A0A4Q0VW75_9BACI|nr:indole-3-glycerol phosphate synthase TrpC [Anaerobacillus alkaliphilus]RXJ03953.1 indole-3-glycerol phosphate synthase TrpC [Anaerobacillus alkaliphilus]
MLDRIVAVKHEEVAKLELRETLEVSRYSLFESLSNPHRNLALIAEVKKASPSKGIIKKDFHPVDIAKHYEEGKADAISVLTDEQFFLGHHTFLSSIKQQVKLPILRKDFIIHSKQIEESLRIGADAILLIATILEKNQLHEFYLEAYEKGLECLVEVHSLADLEKVFATFTPQIVGVNNRDLQTFNTTITQTIELAKQLPKEQFVVSESGIRSTAHLEQLEGSARAILVGETLMRARTPLEGIQSLFGEAFHETFA